MNRATNAAVMRASNRKLILNLIRSGPISRVELADQVHLTRASITQIVDELLEAGLVEAVSTDCGQKLGRKRVQLAIRSDGRFAFAVNIRRRRCHVGLINLQGDVLSQTEIWLAGKSVSSAIDEISAELTRLREAFRLPDERILGVGVSAPGPVDYQNGVILNPPNFSSWHNTPVCAMLSERTGLHALLEKDTNARTLEEKYFGAAKSISSFMLVQIDDGVGSGVMIHDRIYRGTRGMSSEIGHTSICFDGPVCTCGNRGCLENYLKIPALLENTPYSDWESLAAHQNEPQAIRVLDHAAECLAAALVNAINLYDLEKVILTGDVALCPGPLLERLNLLVQNRVLSRASVDRIPVISSLADKPVRAGAMSVLHEMYQDRL